MAQVDFTNAIIEQTTQFSTRNPVSVSYSSLYSGYLFDSEETLICSNYSVTQTVNEHRRFVLRYTGTFNTSGTEFYISQGGSDPYKAKWKVSNINFSAGDLYTFTIAVNMIADYETN